MLDMRRRRHTAIPLIVAGALGVGAGVTRGDGPAGSAEPTAQELMEQIRALQAKVQSLEAAQDKQEEKLTAEEVDATVDSVLRDADRRSQLLAEEGFTAGYDRGKFLIQSADGNFVLNPNIQFQLRYVYNYREDSDNDEFLGGAENQDGLEVRRLKFAFEGNAFTPELKYKFQWATNRNGGSVSLEEAVVVYKFNESWAVKGGQYKDVTFREEQTSSKRQLAVERSLVNEVLAGGVTDYVQGVALVWDDGAEGNPYRAEFGYSDGINSDNTNFVDGGGSAAFGVASPGYGAYARGEYLFAGDWKQYDDFTAMNNTQDLLVLGAGAHYTEAGDGDALFHTVDGQWETGPFGVYVAYIGVAADAGADDGGGSTYDWGALAQVGYMLSERWEIFGRYDYIAPDDERTGLSEDSFNEFTVGFNHYVHGHHAKFTFDVIWLPDGTPNDQNGTGVLAPDSQESQFVARGQFQLLL